ncbi:MAG: Hsp33 family molecular chaperone HslO [Firmicutes bacterium]|nr:Hsp33 family molecular chaperone HslO [Bacillota bacterium]
MNDYIVKALAANGEIRAIAAISSETVEEARRTHNLSPVVTAALGRMLTAAAMMGTDLKGEGDLVTIQIRSLGPIKGMVVTSDSKSRVKGYAFNPHADVPLKSNTAGDAHFSGKVGKLDVSAAVGEGYLSVIKDIGLKKPYSGSIQLRSGEIAEDLTYYFATSEQTPSSVGLGVLVDSAGVRRAGGFIIQLMPGASESTAIRLEDAINSMPYVTDLLEQGLSPEEILQSILEPFGLDILEKTGMSYYCNCTRERVEKALISIGAEELDKIIADKEGANLHCHFCSKEYNFTHEDVVKLREEAR